MKDDAVLTALLDGRVRALNEQPAAAGSFVLLWLQGQRRLRQNLAASHAQRRANELGLPLVVYEGLRLDYPYACDRFHAFVLEGAADNAADAAARGLEYAFFLETPGGPRGVLHALAARAALVVTDWLPAFIHPAQTKRLAARAPCRVEAVDAAGVLPLSAFPRQELAARTLRPKAHRLLAERLHRIPEPRAKIGAPAKFDWGFDPFDGEVDAALASLPIDHSVGRVHETRGGRQAALRRLRAFIDRKLRGYAGERSEPSADHTSGLSAYLHFGHAGSAEIALAIRESGAPRADKDAFLEELIVRRELAYNFAARNARHASIDAAPGWALSTLRQHEGDAREATYTDAELEQARTRDDVWNAVQRQLVREGRIHNHLRMLWGKNILAWSKDAAEAHRRIAWLNDKHALDGRDAVSAANFLWIFGLHDRPFPERPVFGTVRSMTSGSARKKLDLDGYLAHFSVSQKI